MKEIASLTLVLGTLLFSTPSDSSEICPETSRAASKAAQDYRNAVGKVRIACDKSWEECNQSRGQADEILALVIAANEAMLAACTFTGSPGRGDSLPVTAETVFAAIDSLPEAVLVPCNFVIIPPGGNLELGCPNGWLLNIPRSDLAASSATPTSFSYSLNVNTSGSIPVSSSVAGSCTLTFGTPTGVPVTGTATFSSSSDGALLNRLQLVVNTISFDSVEFNGCGGFSSLLDVLEAYLSSSIETTIADILSHQFCGAKGPELFSPCP